MEDAELRQLVGEILDEEERPDVNWSRVEALCDAVNERLRHAPDTRCPDAVYHYVDDADIRQRDHKYALWQRSLAREYVVTGEMVEHAPSVAMPWWGCLFVLGVPIGVILWAVL